MIEVGLVMGSESDWEIMRHAARTLRRFAVGLEARVISAHRTPDLLFLYAEAAAERGLQAVIAGAGGAAHLPGMLAAKTLVPVLAAAAQLGPRDFGGVPDQPVRAAGAHAVPTPSGLAGAVVQRGHGELAGRAMGK